MTEALTITTAPRTDHHLDVTIQLGPERTAAALHQAARLIARKTKISGFRPGKAPDATVIRLFGRDKVLREIMNDLGQEVYKEALEGKPFEPYAQAQLEDVQLDPITFKLVVPLAPTVDLGDYRSIRLDAPDVHVDETDVNKWLDRVREERATWQAVERPAEIGDTVVIDIHGAVGEDTIMDNQDWELLLKAEGGWLPGFNDAFVGVAAGDEKTFPLTYPEDSVSRYRGQEATFQATMKEVQARVRPALDDELARSLGDYEDMADLRARLLAQMTAQRTKKAEGKLDNDAFEALIEKATLAYPHMAVDGMIHEILQDHEKQLAQRGYSLEDYLRLQGTTQDAYRDQLKPQAERQLQGRLILTRLAQAEGIVVTDEEAQAELDRITANGESDEQKKELLDLFRSEQGQFYINQDLLTKKTLARLREIVTGQAPELVRPEAEAAETSSDAAIETVELVDAVEAAQNL